MGYRTVIVVPNDTIHTIKDDPEFGQKVYTASWMFHIRPDYGHNNFKVIEVCHADQLTAMMLHDYRGTTLGVDFFRRDATEEQRRVDLLKNAAGRLGYRLAKYPKRG